MKKTLLLIACFLFCLQSYAQSISFNQLLHLLKEKDVPKYLTSAPLEFSKAVSVNPLDRYIKNAGTPNEEILDYEGKMPSIGYSTKNLTFMYTLIKQIKFRQILKDDSNGSVYYQFGDTQMTVMINIDKKRSYASLSLYNKK